MKNVVVFAPVAQATALAQQVLPGVQPSATSLTPPSATFALDPGMADLLVELARGSGVTVA